MGWIFSSLLGQVIMISCLALVNNACFVSVARLRKWRMEKKQELVEKKAEIIKLSAYIQKLEDEVSLLAENQGYSACQTNRKYSALKVTELGEVVQR